MKEKIKYYSLDRIKKIDAQYNIIYGLRSNGKTFSVQLTGLENYIKYGEQMCIVRRYEIDFQGKRGSDMFTHLVANPKRGNIVKELSNGEWEDIYYWSSRWYLCKYNEKGERIKDAEPFCYGFSISSQEHDKSTSYPKITTIMFDEFMTRGAYLVDEFVKFTNVLSTIIRDRENVRIYMLGNTVNKYNPYFKEMGLDNVLKMKPGEIQTYQFATLNDKTLKIAVEYADNPNPKGKPSDVYFAFNNPKLKMITNGMWELAIYPHLPYKYERDNIVAEYFVLWENEALHCEIIQLDNIMFTYCHSKTTPIKDTDNYLIFSTEYNAKPNYRRRITKPSDEIARKISWFFANEKVFYSNNEVGEIMRNYINWCEQDRGFV